LFFTSLLKKDRQAVEALFKKFERAGENAGRLTRQMDLAKDAIKGARRARKLTAARRGSARARGSVARSTRR
jgi:hypothetical protein